MKMIVEYYKQYFLKLIILQIVFCLLIATFICVTSKEKQELAFDSKNLLGGYISEEGYAVFNEEDGMYGLLFDVVTEEVKKGWYKVRLEYNTDYNDNGFIVQALKENALNEDIGIENRTIRLRAVRESQDVHAWLRKDSALRIGVLFCGGGSLQVKKIILQQIPNYTPFFCLVLCLLLLNMELYDMSCLPAGEVKRRRYVRIGIAVIVLFASIPLMNDFTIHGHDYEHHLYSMEGIAEGLLSGQFPVKIMPNWWNEFGDGAPMFYADAMLYIPALALILGYTVQAAYKFYIVFINLLTAWIAYKCFFRISKNSRVALSGAFLYSLNLYRLIDIYIRCAVGEYTALTFLPLILLGIYLIEEEGWIYLALGVTGCLQSHMLVCVMAGLLFMLFGIVHIKWILKKSVFVNFCKAGFFSLLWNLWFIIPFLNMYGSNAYKIHVYKAARSMEQMGVAVSDLFSLSFRSIYDDIYVMGLPLFIGLIVATIMLLICRKNIFEKEESKKPGMLLTASIALALVAVILSMDFVPYSRASQIHVIVERLVSMLEFPFRFMGMAALLSVSAITSAYVLWESVSKGETRRKFKAAGNVVLSMILFLTALGTMLSYRNLLASSFIGEHHSEYYVMEYQMTANKWLPIEADENETEQKFLGSSEDIVILDYEKKYTNIKMDCINKGMSEGYIDVPLFYYPCYKAKDDKTGESLELTYGENARIRIILPPEYQGSVLLKVSERKLWRISEVISVLSVCAVFFIGRAHNRKRFRKVAK